METDSYQNRSGKKRLSLKSKPSQDGVAAELLSILESVTSDGRISDDEIVQLRDWLGQYPPDPQLPGLDFLRTVVDTILADGIVSEAERNALYKAVEKVLPPDSRRAATERRRAVELVERERTRQDQHQQKAEEDRIKRLSKPVVRISFMVAGVLHAGRGAVIDRYLEPGDRVFLIREPANPKDSNAILIRTKAGYDIGYVPREDAAMLARFLDAYFLQSATVTKILRGKLAPIPVVHVEMYDPKSPVAHAMPASLLPVRSNAPSTGCLTMMLVCILGFLLSYLTHR